MRKASNQLRFYCVPVLLIKTGIFYELYFVRLKTFHYISISKAQFMALTNVREQGEGLINKEIGDKKEAEGLTAKRDGYSIRYFCQDGSLQAPELASTACLTPAEQTSLDNLIFKLLDNGVKLGIFFCTLQEVLARQVSSITPSACHTSLEES